MAAREKNRCEACRRGIPASYPEALSLRRLQLDSRHRYLLQSEVLQDVTGNPKCKVLTILVSNCRDEFNQRLALTVAQLPGLRCYTCKNGFKLQLI